MRTVYVVLIRLLGLAILAQFYFAAVGAFDRPRDDDSFALHSLIGMAVIPLLSVLATIVAALCRAPGRLTGLTLLPFGLVLVQVLLVAVSNAVAGGAEERTSAAALAVFGLHAVNGLAIMAVVGVLSRRAGALRAAGRPASAGKPIAPTASPVG
ncbi:MAG TPA: DUF6220 domain-containing protein [Pilimelia sp.]|nr:DUF6220 domain-containing protein [Pilimelia sp.]